MSIDVSLLVVNHGTPGDVARLLASLQTHPPSCGWEAVVVNTTPQGAYALPENESPVRALTMECNRGFGAAVNRGAVLSRGEFLLALNADILLTDDCLPRMIDHLRTHPETGILVPRLVESDGTLQYNARTHYSLLTILCRRTWLGRLLPGVVRRHLLVERDHTAVFPVDWGMGAALLARRELLEEGKLFDERFFLYFEDVDLCARAWAGGYRVEYFPPATLVHAHRRDSAHRPWSRAGAAHLGSAYKFWRKHGTLRPAGAGEAPPVAKGGETP